MWGLNFRPVTYNRKRGVVRKAFSIKRRNGAGLLAQRRPEESPLFGAFATVYQISFSAN